jgi:hypothetical protein
MCVWLAVTGCTFGMFHGVQSAGAEDFFDHAEVLIELAVEGDAEAQGVVSEYWTGNLEESEAARWKSYVNVMSTSHTPEDAPLAETVAMGFLASNPVEHGIAIPLDAESAAALREVLRDMAHPSR